MKFGFDFYFPLAFQHTSSAVCRPNRLTATTTTPTGDCICKRPSKRANALNLDRGRHAFYLTLAVVVCPFPGFRDVSLVCVCSLSILFSVLSRSFSFRVHCCAQNLILLIPPSTKQLQAWQKGWRRGAAAKDTRHKINK